MAEEREERPPIPRIVIPFEQIATNVYNALEPLVAGIPKAVVGALESFISAHDKEAADAFKRGFNSVVSEEDRI